MSSDDTWHGNYFIYAVGENGILTLTGSSTSTTNGGDITASLSMATPF
ncbi:MAG: hypothetical protein ACR5K7_00565 [Symbiopectobacterium sp.]